MTVDDVVERILAWEAEKVELRAKRAEAQRSRRGRAASARPTSRPRQQTRTSPEAPEAAWAGPAIGSFPANACSAARRHLARRNTAIPTGCRTSPGAAAGNPT
jgi:hypothetical protein